MSQTVHNGAYRMMRIAGRSSKRVRAATLVAAALCLGGMVTATRSFGGRTPAVRPPAPSQQPTQPAVLVPTGRAETSGPYQAPVRLPHFQDGTINESSGVVAGRRNPGLLWTHNDSGDKPHVYAVDSQGVTVGLFQVRGARAVDWEDMAAGPASGGAAGPYLYIGDIGDNGATRRDCTVYRITEPKIRGTRAGTKEAPLAPEGVTVRIPFAYPDRPHNAEALLVHPRTGTIYIVTKEETGIAGVYKFPRQKTNGARVTLSRIGSVAIRGEMHPYPNQVTGGDISPDGRKVALVTYASAYEFTLPRGATNFDAIWKTKPIAVSIPALPQCEAICYTRDGKSLIVTSEQTPPQVYRLDAKQR